MMQTESRKGWIVDTLLGRKEGGDSLCWSKMEKHRVGKCGGRWKRDHICSYSMGEGSYLAQNNDVKVIRVF